MAAPRRQRHSAVRDEQLWRRDEMADDLAGGVGAGDRIEDVVPAESYHCIATYLVLHRYIEPGYFLLRPHRQHHSGMSHPTAKRDLYDADHGKKVLSMAPGLERLNILPFRVAAYDTKQKKMDFFDPSRKEGFLFIWNKEEYYDSLVPSEGSRKLRELVTA